MNRPLLALASLLALTACLPEDDARKDVSFTRYVLDIAGKPAEVDTDERGFCRAEPGHVICSRLSGRAPALAELQRIDMRLRLAFRRDEAMEGRWSTGTRGVCLTFALELADRLAKAGVGSDYITLAAGRADGEAHATLIVRADDGRLYEMGDGRDELPSLYDPDRYERVAWKTGARRWVRGRAS